MAKNKCIPLFLMSVLVLAGMTWGCNRKDVSDSQGPLLGAYPSDAPENLSDRRLSDIFSKVSEICLETGDSCLIGDYNSKFVKRNGVIYVKSLNEIFLFDDKGKFLRKVSKVGNGPGEYDGIRDFDIVPGERGDEVWVCASNGIFRYNSATADFIAKINYKGYPNQLKLLSAPVKNGLMFAGQTGRFGNSSLTRIFPLHPIKSHNSTKSATAYFIN